MIIRKAQPHEYEAVRTFYYNLIDDMAPLPYHPKWQKGIYPADEYLLSAIKAGQLYVADRDSSLIGAMIVSHDCNDGYASAHWSVAAAPEEATVVHALGVSVSAMRQGIGTAMVQHVLHLAAQTGQKTVRLDVIDGNLPARCMYERQGFRFVERINMFYEDTGWCNFDLYEQPVTGKETP